MRFSQTGGWTLGPPVYLNINKTEGAEKERREARSLRKEDDSPDNSDETSERLLNDFHRRFGQKFRIQHWGFYSRRLHWQTYQMKLCLLNTRINMSHHWFFLWFPGWSKDVPTLTVKVSAKITLSSFCCNSFMLSVGGFVSSGSDFHVWQQVQTVLNAAELKVSSRQTRFCSGVA